MNDNELKTISIALLGGSTSGKTTFFSGIDLAFRSNTKMFNGTSFSFVAESIRSGISSNDDASCKIKAFEGENFAQRMAQAAPAFGAAAPAFGGGAPAAPAFGGGAPAAPAFGGGAPAAPAFGSGAPAAPAFGGGAPAAPAAEPASQNVREEKSISVSEGDQSNTLFNGSRLSAEMEKAWSIDPKLGFKPGTATTKYVEVTFKVMVKGQPKCRLVITDYAGELLDNAGGVPEAMLRELTEHIAGSNAAIILANSRAMSSHIKEVITHDRCMFVENDTRTALSATRVNDLMQCMRMDNYSILLAITQTDSPQVDHRLSDDGFARAALDLSNFIYQPTFVTASNRNWSYGVLPVSAIGRKDDGSPNVDENNQIVQQGAEINQVNIDTAILFCIYTAVLSVQKEVEAELAGFSVFSGIKKENRQRKAILTKQSEDLSELRNIISSDRSLFDKIFNKSIPMEVRSEIK